MAQIKIVFLDIGTLEAVDSEILGDYDACLHADEPLASEDCYARSDLQNLFKLRA